MLALSFVITRSHVHFMKISEEEGAFPGSGNIKSGCRKFGLFLLKKRMRWNTNERSFVYPLLFSAVFLVPWTHLPVTGSKYPALQTNLFQHLKALKPAYSCLLSRFFLLCFRFLHLKNFAWAHMWLLPNCFDILTSEVSFFLLKRRRWVGDVSGWVYWVYWTCIVTMTRVKETSLVIFFKERNK
jgi:hypothetical protein